VIASAVFLMLLGHAAVSAQQTPVRDQVMTLTAGTATLSGVVVDDEERPQPVRRAIVTLTGAELRPSRGTITDDEGRFSFANLPAGRFTLTVSRAAYITSAFGAKRPGRPGTSIVVDAGAKVTGITVRLWRGAVVAGVVRDENGFPVPGIPVTAIAAKTGSTSMRTLTNNGSTTNEQGEYRIFGLEPGAYVVSAQPASGGSQILAFQETQVDAAIAAFKRGTAASPTPAAAPPPVAGRAFDYGPVYYPNSISLAQATPLRLAPGQVLEGIDLMLQRITTSIVSGVVLRPDGTPAAGAAVQLEAVLPPGPFSGTPGAIRDATAGPDGTFRLVQIAPGAYRVIARASSGPPPPPTPGFVTPVPTGAQLWATTMLTVGGTDIEGLALTVEPGLTLSGRITFRSETQKPPVPSTLRVTVMPASVVAQPAGSPIRTIAFVPGVTVRADGTFEIASIPPGTYRLLINSATLQPPGVWTLRSAVMGDRDLLDADFELMQRGDATVIVVFDDKRTELSGALSTATGAPASDVFVIAYAADRRLWGPGARRVQAVRPGVDGRYSINDLPAGEYLLAAVLDIDQNDWNDPAFLEQLVPASIKITIGEGERKTQDLRIGG
jgi:uncharacterized protein (DUF2141 family)